MITDWIFLKFETLAKGTKLKLEIAQIKTTTNGRRPQNIKSEISVKICGGSTILGGQTFFGGQLNVELKFRFVA